MAVWYSLIISLRDFLRSQTSLDGIKIDAGALNPQDYLKDVQTGAIFVMRDREGKEKLYKGGEGEASFFVECWTRSNDKDPAVGYGLLSDLEDKFTTALTAWATLSGPPLTVADTIEIDVEETLGDADMKRPLLGSRKAIRVVWSKRTL